MTGRQKKANSIFQTLLDEMARLKKKVAESGGLVDTQDGDPIYAYVYVDGILEEQQVKGLMVHENALYAVIDNRMINYDTDSLLTQDDYWYSLDGYSDMLHIQTMWNIMELIDQYLTI